MSPHLTLLVGGVPCRRCGFGFPCQLQFPLRRREPQRTQKLLARKQQSMTHQHYKSDPHVYLEAFALSVKKLFEKLGMVGKRFGSLPYTSMCENAQNLKRQLNYSSWFLEFCFSGWQLSKLNFFREKSWLDLGVQHQQKISKLQIYGGSSTTVSCTVIPFLSGYLRVCGAKNFI